LRGLLLRGGREREKTYKGEGNVAKRRERGRKGTGRRRKRKGKGGTQGTRGDVQ